jgi:transposase-like protein
VHTRPSERRTTMTDLQKERITRMRSNGISYNQIASTLGISVNSVKSYCQRNQLGSQCAQDTSSVLADEKCCKQCAKELNQIKSRKKQKFCSDTCRMAWWNRHRHMIRGQACLPLPCAHCGKSFRSYGKQHRKYCSHACYISSRYGVGREQHV